MKFCPIVTYFLLFFFRCGQPFHPVTRAGWINLLAATLLMYGLGRIHGKKEALEKERELHE